MKTAAKAEPALIREGELSLGPPASPAPWGRRRMSRSKEVKRIPLEVARTAARQKNEKITEVCWFVRGNEEVTPPNKSNLFDLFVRGTGSPGTGELQTSSFRVVRYNAVLRRRRRQKKLF